MWVFSVMAASMLPDRFRDLKIFPDNVQARPPMAGVFSRSLKAVTTTTLPSHGRSMFIPYFSFRHGFQKPQLLSMEETVV
jgi:hypothetical protein